VIQTCNLSTEAAEAREWKIQGYSEFQANLVYTARPCLKNKTKQSKTKTNKKNPKETYTKN
jgi:hypothetical protein